MHYFYWPGKTEKGSGEETNLLLDNLILDGKDVSKNLLNALFWGLLLLDPFYLYLSICICFSTYYRYNLS